MADPITQLKDSIYNWAPDIESAKAGAEGVLNEFIGKAYLPAVIEFVMNKDVSDQQINIIKNTSPLAKQTFETIHAAVSNATNIGGNQVDNVANKIAYYAAKETAQTEGFSLRYFVAAVVDIYENDGLGAAFKSIFNGQAKQGATELALRSITKGVANAVGGKIKLDTDDIKLLGDQLFVDAMTSKGYQVTGINLDFNSETSTKSAKTAASEMQKKRMTSTTLGDEELYSPELTKAIAYGESINSTQMYSSATGNENLVSADIMEKRKYLTDGEIRDYLEHEDSPIHIDIYNELYNYELSNLDPTTQKPEQTAKENAINKIGKMKSWFKTPLDFEFPKIERNNKALGDWIEKQQYLDPSFSVPDAPKEAMFLTRAEVLYDDKTKGMISQNYNLEVYHLNSINDRADIMTIIDIKRPTQAEVEQYNVSNIINPDKAQQATIEQNKYANLLISKIRKNYTAGELKRNPQLTKALENQGITIPRNLPTDDNNSTDIARQTDAELGIDSSKLVMTEYTKQVLTQPTIGELYHIIDSDNQPLIKAFADVERQRLTESSSQIAVDVDDKVLVQKIIDRSAAQAGVKAYVNSRFPNLIADTKFPDEETISNSVQENRESSLFGRSGVKDILGGQIAERHNLDSLQNGISSAVDAIGNSLKQNVTHTNDNTLVVNARPNTNAANPAIAQNTQQIK